MGRHVKQRADYRDYHVVLSRLLQQLETDAARSLDWRQEVATQVGVLQSVLLREGGPIILQKHIEGDS